MKPMVNFDKLCEVYATDMAKGGSARGPGEKEVVEDESPLDAQHTSQPTEDPLSFSIFLYFGGLHGSFKCSLIWPLLGSFIFLFFSF